MLVQSPLLLEISSEIIFGRVSQSGCATKKNLKRLREGGVVSLTY